MYLSYNAYDQWQATYWKVSTNNLNSIINQMILDKGFFVNNMAKAEDIKLNKGNEIENKLIRLEEMKKKNLISEDEYKALRMKALNNF